MQLPSLPCASLTPQHPGRLDQPVSDLPLVAANHSDSPGIFVKPSASELSYFPRKFWEGLYATLCQHLSLFTRSKISESYVPQNYLCAVKMSETYVPRNCLYSVKTPELFSKKWLLVFSDGL